MEGGYHPWRNRPVPRNVVDLDSFGAPLPPPPAGLRWERHENNSWVLLAEPATEIQPAEVGEEGEGLLVSGEVGEVGEAGQHKSVIFEHTLLPHDTLQGICLHYRAAVQDVRRLNCFSGNNIHFKKTLLVPLAGPVHMQPNTHDVLLQKFKNLTGESGMEARVYLEEAGWDLNSAVGCWRVDEEWEQGRYLASLREGITGMGMSGTTGAGAGAGPGTVGEGVVGTGPGTVGAVCAESNSYLTRVVAGAAWGAGVGGIRGGRRGRGGGRGANRMFSSSLDGVSNKLVAPVAIRVPVEVVPIKAVEMVQW
ncbi:hypothetical protein B484DRAFT_396124 [Ochromonadaceae sp. CCMP2298]|nr:hypothetical protein B484DRAFT_396124 [Ochromonadaceae sp. CCMP2298]